MSTWKFHMVCFLLGFSHFPSFSLTSFKLLKQEAPVSPVLQHTEPNSITEEMEDSSEDSSEGEGGADEGAENSIELSHLPKPDPVTEKEENEGEDLSIKEWKHYTVKKIRAFQKNIKHIPLSEFNYNNHMATVLEFIKGEHLSFRAFLNF